MHRRGVCHAHVQLLVFYSRLEHKAGPGRDTSTEGLALVNSLLRGDLIQCIMLVTLFFQ